MKKLILLLAVSLLAVTSTANANGPNWFGNDNHTSQEELDSAISTSEQQTQSQHDEIISNQAEVDGIQDWYNNHQRELLVIGQRNIDYSQDTLISSNTAGIAKNTAWNVKQDTQIADNTYAIGRLDGMIAAQTALNSIVDNPVKGRIQFGVGFGHYRGNNALGAAVQFGDDAVQVKLSAAGSDYDRFHDMTFGGSLNFNF